VCLGEQGEHLLDLRNLLRGGAEKAEQGFTEGLAQNAQTGEGFEAAAEVRVAAPRERVAERGPVGAGPEVAVQGKGRGVGPGERRAPLEVAFVQAELSDVVGPKAGPDRRMTTWCQSRPYFAKAS